LNKPDIVKYLIQEQNEISPGHFIGNAHLFDCLVDIRHAGVTTDSRDDVVVTDRSVWCTKRVWGDVWKTISEGDCDVLRHLLRVGLDVNQSIQMYDRFSDNKSVVRPFLFTLIDEWDVRDRIGKMRMMLEAGVDVNVRVTYRECDSVLDREGVSALERAKKLVNKYSKSRYNSRNRVTEYKRVMNEIRRHVRRHSI
jgi:hypothetical protein